ncbi:hypothetical protein [Lyngbya aestuarii]|uniref:hypothetical protein n=1 Tax=Lyngbya aestuarii TaxID=118322 RepID=UPI00403D88BB
MISSLLIAYTSQSPISHTSQSTTAQLKTKKNKPDQREINTPLEAAIEELRVFKIKIESEDGINRKEYSEDLADTLLIVDSAYGNPKALEAVKSSAQGHKLALQFWQCDQVTGYEATYQCRDKVLQEIFVKYPDIKAQALEIVADENLSFISEGLDEKAVLQAVWQKTHADTSTALQEINPVDTAQSY